MLDLEVRHAHGVDRGAGYEEHGHGLGLGRRQGPGRRGHGRVSLWGGRELERERGREIRRKLESQRHQQLQRYDLLLVVPVLEQESDRAVQD